MFVLRSSVKKRKQIFNEPDAKKAPPTWIRAIMITTCTLVSYFHGSNDGQKGVGLLMVVLIAFLPTRFALNSNLPISDVSASVRKIEASLMAQAGTDNEHGEHLRTVANNAHALGAQLDTTHFKDKKEVFAARKAIQGLVKTLDSDVKNKILAGNTSDVVKDELKTLTKSYEFSPFWAILMIAICLGAGTMVGWKRIVVTIGEKIGKSHLSYAQGASAELCAAATIGVSSYFGLPVSTTHVLSSGVAGTMVAQGGVQNLRKKTIVNIAIAWILTLPVTMILSMLFYFLFRLFV
jgi:PiT family inorganic phosphate transporter